MDNRKYKHIFFDLDGTLWDFESNSIATLKEIYEVFNLQTYFPNAENLISVYKNHNSNLWAKYRLGKIRKEHLSVKRFELTLNEAGLVNKRLSKTISDYYIKVSPTKTQLIPDAISVLNYLIINYKLHIITNGFYEVQAPKLELSGLKKYFTNVITSEEVGAMKPALAIFNYSLRKANCLPYDAIMIGDEFETDIIGARNSGIDQIYLKSKNTTEKENITYQILALNQLFDIL
jgi:putative hydrolase of the HAD superfamily